MGIDIYLDGANLEAMCEGRKNPLVRGFTTNPSLARQAGVTDYEAFCKEALEIADGLPISFEVFSDEWDEMECQARKIASWGSNVNVKIPITNTEGESAAPLVKKLSDDGIVCNVTAVFTEEQVNEIAKAMKSGIISIFAGRITDTGGDAESIIANAVVDTDPPIKILWASCREVLNIYQASNQGCHIITVTPDILSRYEKFKDKDLTEFSLDTVRMFYNDAAKSGYVL
jgi:transaldolase